MRRRLLVLIVGVVAASCVLGSDDTSDSSYLRAPSSVTTTTSPTLPAVVAAVRSGPVFDPAEDRLCVWFADEELSRIVEDAYGGATGWSDEGIFRSGVNRWGCWWQTSNWSLSLSPQGEPSGFHEEWETERDEAEVHPHPALTDGVYLVDWPPGDWPPRIVTEDDWTGLDVLLTVEGVQQPLGFRHEIPPGFEGDVDTALSIADEMLRRMGWVR